MARRVTKDAGVYYTSLEPCSNVSAIIMAFAIIVGFVSIIFFSYFIGLILWRIVL